MTSLSEMIEVYINVNAILCQGTYDIHHYFAVHGTIRNQQCKVDNCIDDVFVDAKIISMRNGNFDYSLRMNDNYIQWMRHQIHKQKQNIAFKTIQPLARLVSTTSHDNNEPITPISQIPQRLNASHAGESSQKITKKVFDPHFITNSSNFKSTYRSIIEKQLRAPSLQKKQSNRSEKIVGKEPIASIQHTHRSIKPSFKVQKYQLDDHNQHNHNEEHIQNLMKVNENLKNLQGKNNEMLLKSIELLRHNEKFYLPTTPTEADNIRKDDSLLLLQTIEDDDSQSNEKESGTQIGKGNSILRTLKEEAAVRFKEKIKVKQSRRNIYRTLKNRNDNLNKIKLKTHHSTPNKDRPNPQILQIQQMQRLRLHCPQIKQISHNIRSANFRTIAKSYYENMRQLRIDTKMNSLQGKPTFQLRTTKCQFLSNDIDSLNNAYKKKRGLEAYQQIVSKLRKNQETSPTSVNDRKDLSHKNVFRQLTPWHFEEV